MSRSESGGFGSLLVRDCTLYSVSRASRYGPVYEQLTHSDSRTPADLLKRSLTAGYLSCCLEEGLRRGGLRLEAEQRGVLTTALLHHMHSCSCNAYQVQQQRLPAGAGAGAVRGSRPVELGGACYPVVSLVNHACSPNVVRHSHGNVCVVRAIRTIPKVRPALNHIPISTLQKIIVVTS